MAGCVCTAHLAEELVPRYTLGTSWRRQSDALDQGCANLAKRAKFDQVKMPGGV